MSLRGGGWRSELLERVVSLGPVDCQGPSSVPIPDMESTSRFLYDLPPSVRWRFCRVMDGLSDLDWTRFASEVLSDQTDVQLAERRERRTDWVMVHLENRNRTVGYLSNVLERLHLFRPRDIILTSPPNQNPSFPQLPPTDPPPKRPEALPTFSCLSTAVHSEVGGAKALPGPGPPPSCLLSAVVQDEVINDITSSAPEPLISGVALQWPFEEVHSGTEGFSSTLQVGEGGFGVVYRASLRNVQCAVKRLRRPDQSEDCLLDWSRLRESFRTEVEKLSKFRHPNIVDLMGFSEGCGEMCLIYSFMDHRSLEHQLHNECVSLSWPQRIRIVEEASAALQFLHSSPEEVIHGDVKSSNILLDCHLVAKLSDFGLARFTSRSGSGGPGASATQTASLGRTATLQGTQAYLPDDYIRNRVLRPAMDVFSFGVVLLEVMSGRRAVEKNQRSRERYLKDLVKDLEDPTESAEHWRTELDSRLTAGVAEPTAWEQVAGLACETMNKSWKKRPRMTEVFEKLKDIHARVRSPVVPSDSSVEALCKQFTSLGPSEDMYSPPSSSSLLHLHPHPLHCSASLPPFSCVSSLAGPCETDESRGFSQFDLESNGRLTSQHFSPAEPSENQIQDQNHGQDQSAEPTAVPHPDTRGQSTAGLCSSVGDQESSVMVALSQQRLVENKAQYEGETGTSELLSSHDLYGDVSCEDFRGPEESDELDYLPIK
ncbi:interleukin-1 receptor-associated kinase 1 isoform X3 [Gouania willdenowi]|uniref:interleukin-1 receptor-associated kinase 1 isoform X3 n=1 Tax=Gouania willdenowi TaxID=441366 RepID=UPI001055BF8F|nr:interleukin-1 receptor-associated kinase 1-like isoform X3 [Gouania willdenowi]